MYVKYSGLRRKKGKVKMDRKDSPSRVAGKRNLFRNQVNHLKKSWHKNGIYHNTSVKTG